ncbi:glycosyltransferase family 2 protein [Longitalea luteola]|uniref:glycosyltransferase family 2 protein n=1 Tax=Longitalea luteola TaxID=2812563 RepID=UPI001A974DA9
MLKTPFFSIIIPTFNSAATVREALDSVLMQTFAEFEVLVIDGISNDGTLQILKEYQIKDSRIRFISEQDKGTYDAMNKGIRLSKGDWLYFLGSDDALFSNDTLSQVFQKAKETDSAVIYGNVKLDGDTGWARHNEIYAGEFNLRKLLSQNICHQAIFYQRKVFKEIGLYNDRYKICADWDFNLRCFSRYKFAYLNIIVAHYYGGGKSSVTEDTIFSKDRIYNIAAYFKNTLYFNEFVQFRTYFRRMIFQKNVPLSLGVRIRLLFFSIILKLQKER